MNKGLKRKLSLAQSELGSPVSMTVGVIKEFWYSEENCKGAYLVESPTGERISMRGEFHRPLLPDLEYEITGIIGQFKGSKQIEVEHYKSLPPKTRYGMIAFLKTITGINKKAIDLYQAYGTECLEILKTDPERVIKEIGILRKWAYKAQEYLLYEVDGELTITELLNYGVSIKEAKKLYQAYKEEVIEVLKENPYVLSQKLKGFGFNKCEKIANEINFNMLSTYRIQAAIFHVLEDATHYGHCFLPGNLLVQEVVNLLQRPDIYIYPQHIYPVIQDLLNQGELVVEKERVYLKEYHEMEKYACEKLTQLTSRALTRTQEEVEEALSRVLAREPDLVLEERQREAVIRANLKRGSVFILNGHAGTGKTFTLRVIIAVHEELLQMEKSAGNLEDLLEACETEEELEALVEAIVAGYTEEVQALKDQGRGAEAEALETLYEQVEGEEDLLMFLNRILTVCEGSFIKARLPETLSLDAKPSHRKKEKKMKRLTNALYLAPTGKAAKVMARATQQDASTIHKGLHYDPTTHRFKHDETDPLRQEVIVCDETSMLDLWLFNQLLKAIKPGTKLIFLGDTHQLPSIGAGNVLKDLLDSQVIDHVTLNIVKRQGLLSDILKNAKNILEGKMIRNYNETNDAYFINQTNPAAIQETILEEMAKLLKRPEFTMDEVQVLSPMRKGPLGTNMLNYLIQQRFNPDPDHLAEHADTFTCQTSYGVNETLTLYFKTGDRVINVRNNYELVFCEKTDEGNYEENERLGIGITNGECGTIADIIYEEDEDSEELVKTIVVQYEEGYAKYRTSELDNLLHAYCLTIHKSQGSGWKAILFPVHPSHQHMLENNLIYTAWTRSREFAMVIGNEYTLSRAIQTFKAITRYTTLAPRLKYEKLKYEARESA